MTILPTPIMTDIIIKIMIEFFGGCERRGRQRKDGKLGTTRKLHLNIDAPVCRAQRVVDENWNLVPDA